MIAFILKSAVKLLYCAVAFIIVAAVVFSFVGGNMSLSWEDGEAGEDHTLISVKEGPGSAQITVLNRTVTIRKTDIREFYEGIERLLK